MKIKPIFSELNSEFKTRFSELEAKFKTGYGEIYEILKIPDETYDGEYNVTPKVDSQTLNTKEKFMYDNLIVNGIPIFNVSNIGGGDTVYIGEES
jgi:hypothetical protein